jgi:hypothetical protein
MDGIGVLSINLYTLAAIGNPVGVTVQHDSPPVVCLFTQKLNLQIVSYWWLRDRHNTQCPRCRIP